MLSEVGRGGDESPRPGWREGGGAWKSPGYWRGGMRAVTTRLQSPGRSSRIGEVVEECWLVEVPRRGDELSGGASQRGNPIRDAMASRWGEEKTGEETCEKPPGPLESGAVFLCCSKTSRTPCSVSRDVNRKSRLGREGWRCEPNEVVAEVRSDGERGRILAPEHAQ